MAGASGSWEPGQTWYEGLFDKVSNVASEAASKAGELFSFGLSNLTKVTDLLPIQTLGPAMAVVTTARTGNKVNKILFGNTAPGIRLPGSIFDNVLKVPDFYADDEPTILADTVVTAKRITNMFDDTQKLAGQPVNGDLPFWVKTAIVASILVGTALIVKGSFERG